MKQKISLHLLAILFLAFATENSFADKILWSEKLAELKTEISRVEAEKIISKARGVESTYTLTAMDISKFAIYKLDNNYILVVNYQPGAPRPLMQEPDGSISHGQAGSGIDGRVIDFAVIDVANIK